MVTVATVHYILIILCILPCIVYSTAVTSLMGLSVAKYISFYGSEMYIKT